MNETIQTTAPFEAYAGSGPYAFVSYAHADKTEVYNCLNRWRDQGIDMWYDEGIPPAGEWVEEIATAIKGSSIFVVFISPGSVDSRYVKSEVGYALSLDKNILSIYLSETDLPAGLELCLQPFQSIRTEENDWWEKAKEAIQAGLSYAPDDEPIPFEAPPTAASPSAPKHSAPSAEEREAALWRLWEEARESQYRRRKRKTFETSEKLEPAPEPASAEPAPPPTSKPPLPPPAQKRSRKTDVPPKPTSRPFKSKAPAQANTRVPMAVTTSIAESHDGKELQAEPHQDALGNKYSQVPPGNLTVWVPYANEYRVVEIPQGFWMSRKLVTQEDYVSVMGVNPSHFEDGADALQRNLPVNNVSWLDAVSYCKAMTNLSKRHGVLPFEHEYRLPTEAEWEYACRAGTSTAYYFGDDPAELPKHAWFKDNSRKRTHPVGLKPANPWGLFDLYGNVREWVGNSFVNTLLGDSEQDEFRISRGGGYMKGASECQSSSRSTNSLYHRFRNLGFRIVLVPVGTGQ